MSSQTIFVTGSCLPSSGIKWAKKARHLEIVILLAALAITLGVKYPSTMRILYPLVIEKNCKALGFANSTFNKCGYCIGGSSPLEETYGLDCSNVCDGHALFDCNNTCNGKAFVDECTGQCVNSVFDTESSRNCLGMCISGPDGIRPHIPYPDDYVQDDCDICIHSASERASEFKDCAGQCHLPGNLKRNGSEIICGECINPHENYSTASNLTCENNPYRPVCPEKEHLDVCGVCGGDSNSCLAIRDIHPNAIASNKRVMITVRGAFNGLKENITCIFDSLTDPNDIKKFVNGSVNDTGVYCPVNFKPGIYRVGAKIVNGSLEEIQFAENVKLRVYNRLAKYLSMTPNSVEYKGILNNASSLEVTFKGTNTSDYPLICLVDGKDLPRHKGFAKANDSRGRPHTCTIPLQMSSQKVRVAPTYDGVNKLNDGFNLTFFAPPPKPKLAHIADDGSIISVVFDRPIHLCHLEPCSCANLFENVTLEDLGPKIVCKWATKNQLVVSMDSPFTGDVVQIKFKTGVLREDMQKEAESATKELAITAYRVITNSPIAVGIAGPNRIPKCGNFSIFGHHTSPRGSTPSYSWSALRDDNVDLSSQLADVIQKTTGVVLSLEAEWLQTGVNYTFTFTVRPTDGSDVAGTHVIEKMNYPGAFIVAYSNTFLDFDAHPHSSELGLFWEMSVPECLETGNRALGYWTASDPRVKINFVTYMSSIYRIPGNTLPLGETIVFTANAFLGNASKDITTSTVTVKVGSVHFYAKIKGTDSRRVGDNMHINSSLLTLQGTVYGSFAGTLLRYRWSCINELGNPCYSYSPTNESVVYLISETQRYTQEITFDSKQVKDGQRLNFTFEVYNASNPSIFSQDSTVVEVLPARMPQVVIEEITCRGVPVTKRSSTGQYLIPAGASVMIEGSVLATPRKRFKKWNWIVTGSTEAFLIANTHNKSYLFLREGATVGHGVYLVTLRVCNGKDLNCNQDNISMFAYPGVTNCKLTMQPYTALDFVQAQIDSCSVPFGRAPLMYQLYMKSETGDKIPISGPQFGNTIPFTGPAPILKNDYFVPNVTNATDSVNATVIEEPVKDNSTTSFIKFTVEVCDRLFVCNFFDEVEVEVHPVVNKTFSTMNLLEKAQNEASAGDVITALALLSVAAKAGNVTMVQYDLLEYIKLAISIVPLGSGQVALIYASLKPLLYVDNDDIKKKSLAAITAATTKASSLKMTPSLSAISVAYTLTAGVVSRHPYSVDLLKAVSNTQDSLIQTLVKSTKLAERIELVAATEDDSDQPSILFIHHTYLNAESLSLFRNKTDTKLGADVILTFGQKIRDQVGRGNCASSSCNQVVMAMTMYPGRSLHPEDKLGRRMSSTVSIRMFSPDTGEEIFVNEKDGIELKMLQTNNLTTKATGMVSRCHKWDDELEDWSMDTEIINTLGLSEGRSQCIASSTGMFTVLEVKHGLSGGAIAGIIVATLMFVTIMGMVVVFFMKQKREAKNAAKLSKEELNKSSMSEEEFPNTP